MRRQIGMLAATAALTVAACASTMNVSSYVERGLDVSQYRTFSWGPADAFPTGDPRLDKNPFFQDHMQGAIERDLTLKGLQLTTTAPDLLIHYHANISERMDIDRLDRNYEYCASGGCPVGLRYYEAGTLVLDVIDARADRLVWRGWAQQSVEDSLENADRLERQINEAVTRMLQRFPRARVTPEPSSGAAAR